MYKHKLLQLLTVGRPYVGHLPMGTKTIIKLSNDEPGKLREKVNLA